MILVTGAAGKTGCAIIRALAGRGATVRALVRRAEQEALVRRDGAREVCVGDLAVAADVERAMRGADAVYHICPNMHAAEVRIGQNVIAAARAADVAHFVYHSVLHPQTTRMPHHWNKLQVEERLFESGLAYTILQPTAYMQNLLASWSAIVNEGVLALPYPVETRISLVDLHDVAQVAAGVIGNAAHFYATYELVGTPPLAQTEVAEQLGQALGRTVVATEIKLDAWEKQARQGSALAKYAIETLLSMFRYYAQFGLEGNPHILTALLGRVPTSLQEFVAQVLLSAGESIPG
ncbi:MAG: NmrA family NAD(P)-binding protein [Caldilineaceae bacterium]